MDTPKVLELKEFQTVKVPKNDISDEVSAIVNSKFYKQIKLFPPWSGNNYQWELTSQGWVGYIQASKNYGFSLVPKVRLQNLFGMLSYAYRLKSFFFLEGEYQATTLQEFYDYLAGKLSDFILNRHRKGLFREYISEIDILPYVRGRIDVKKAINKPWIVGIENSYQNHTADIEFNQILSYSLDIISRSRLCSVRILPKVRKAHRIISRYSRPVPFSSKESISFLYNRLNQDYRPIHILCRFFIEHVGPQFNVGEHNMLPFMVNMDRLFELFVYEWLKEHLPKHFSITAQEKIFIGDDQDLFFKADLLIKDKASGKVMCILDTKYKSTSSPESNDLAQMIAYAQTKGSDLAILIYPIILEKPFNFQSGNISVHCLSFCIEDTLEDSGKKLLDNVLSLIKA